MTKALPTRALLCVLTSATLATPVWADGYRGRNHGGYYGHYHKNYYGGGHHRSNAGGVAAGIIGGVILGAIIADASKSQRERTVVVPQPVYVPAPQPQPSAVYTPQGYTYYRPVPPAQPAYVQSYGYSQCYERTVTESTVSGRIVSYTDRVC